MDLSLELPSPWALFFGVANVFRVTWSEPQIRHRSELTEEAWEMPYRDLAKFRTGYTISLFSVLNWMSIWSRCLEQRVNFSSTVYMSGVLCILHL